MNAIEAGRLGLAAAAMLGLLVSASWAAAQGAAPAIDSPIHEDIEQCVRTEGEMPRLRCYERLANGLARIGGGALAWSLMPGRLRAVIVRNGCEDLIRALSFAPSTYRRIATRHNIPIDEVTVDFEVANRIGVPIRGTAECRFNPPAAGGIPVLSWFAIDGRERGPVAELQRIVEAGIDDSPLFLQRSDDGLVRVR